MRVVVAGSSGLIGTALVAHLRAAGHEVLRLVRRAPAAPDERGWDPAAGTVDPGTFDGVDAVVNLNGAGVADRPWSGARRQALRDSRIVPTEVLARAVAEHRVPDAAQRLGRRLLRRRRRRGRRRVRPAGHRLPRRADPRLGGRRPARPRRRRAGRHAADGAGARAVGRSARPAEARLQVRARRAGSGPAPSTCRGSRWTTRSARWAFLLENGEVDGPVNLTGPRPVTNAEFTAALAQAVHRPAALAVPAFVIRTLAGAQGEEMLLYGQNAVPAKLEAAGYRFRHATVEEALAAALGSWALTMATRRRRGRRRSRRAARRAGAVPPRPGRRGGRGRGPARRPGRDRRRRRLPLRPRLPGDEHLLPRAARGARPRRARPAGVRARGGGARPGRGAAHLRRSAPAPGAAPGGRRRPAGPAVGQGDAGRLDRAGARRRAATGVGARRAVRGRRPRRRGRLRAGPRPGAAAVPVRGARGGGADDVRGVRPAGLAVVRDRDDRGARRRDGARSRRSWRPGCRPACCGSGSGWRRCAPGRCGSRAPSSPRAPSSWRPTRRRPPRCCPASPRPGCTP